jgi:Rho-binding antiterminator
MADTGKEYVPINCSFYDELEALATTRTRSKIQYRDQNGNESTLSDVLIKDFSVANKVEYMHLDDGHKLRLDRIIAVNGKPMPQE